MSVGEGSLSGIRAAAFYYYKAQPQPITERMISLPIGRYTLKGIFSPIFQDYYRFLMNYESLTILYGENISYAPDVVRNSEQI